MLLSACQCSRRWGGSGGGGNGATALAEKSATVDESDAVVATGDGSTHCFLRGGMLMMPCVVLRDSESHTECAANVQRVLS
jgi:hypothetical protein